MQIQGGCTLSGLKTLPSRKVYGHGGGNRCCSGQEAQRVPAFELRWRVALFLERRREHARAQLR